MKKKTVEREERVQGKRRQRRGKGEERKKEVLSKMTVKGK